MAITAGQDILASDFVVSSAGAGDSGKVAKLNSAGKLDESFEKTPDIKNATAGETINGATLPVPVYQNTSDNEFYACDGNDKSKLRFTGFAVSNSTNGNSMYVQFNGIVSGFSGLAEGEKYFLQDAVGTIGTSIGTYKIQVGIAISTTELLILRSEHIESYVSDKLRYSNNTSRNIPGSTPTWTKYKEILLERDLKGIRVGHTVSGGTSSFGSIQTRIYKNGSPIGTSRSQIDEADVYSEDFTDFLKGDLIQVYGYTGGTESGSVYNFRLYYDDLVVDNSISQDP